MKFSQSISTLLWVLFWCLTAGATDAPPAAEEIVKESLRRDRLNFERAKDYTFVRTETTRQFDGKGAEVKRESATYDVVMIEGSPYEKKVKKDGKPLTPKEKAKAEKDFEKELGKRRSESEKDKRERLRKQEKQRAELRAVLDEIPKAFELKLAGEQQIDGLPVWVIDARPRAGYRPAVKRASILPKFEGRIWIDQKDYQWVQVEARTIAPVSFGWILARLHPGAVLTFRQGRVHSDVWLPLRATTRLNAKVALLKSFRAEIDVQWADYRKFQTESRIVSTAEVEEPKQ